MSSIEGTIYWRHDQKERFPNDAERNLEAKGALIDLYNYFAGLGPEANFLKTYQSFLLWASENGNDHSIYWLAEIENEMLRSFGMQNKETIENFLESWLNALRSEFENFDEPQKN